MGSVLEVEFLIPCPDTKPLKINVEEQVSVLEFRKAGLKE
jgi:hypothetical protein